MSTVSITQTSADRADDIRAIHEAAFGHSDEADLVLELMGDDTAHPVLSLLAALDGDAVGHILFTRAEIDSLPSVSAAILAPLAVLGTAQGKGVGSALVRDGLERLEAQGVRFVFVLGDPAYYGRFGFEPATPLGFEATYPLPEAWHDAWRVQQLGRGAPQVSGGRVLCAKALDQPEFWTE